MPGIIGTGLLGQALVSRMLAADLAVVGWDIDPIRLQELAGKGATPARAIEDIAPLSTIILCLPDSQIVGQVVQQLEQLHSLDLGMRDPAAEFDPLRVTRGD